MFITKGFKLLKTINFFYILILSAFIFSGNTDKEATFRLEEEFFNEDIVGYYIAAFDLATGVSNVLMFDYVIESSSTDNYGDDVELFIEFDIKIQVPSIGLNSYTTLSSGKFSITQVYGPLHFRNTDLNLSNTSIGSALIDVVDFSLDDDVNIDDLSSVILQTGKIPNGSYFFDFRLKDSNDDPIQGASISKTIDVYEPSFLELISPGGDIADSLETSIFSSYPVFSWNSDSCSACSYSIRVCEYNSEEHSNLSDAIDDIASFPLDQSEKFYELPQNINVFQYPVSNASDLEMGKLYAWQIKRTYETTVGVNDNYSPIFVFKIMSPDDIAVESSQSDTDVLSLVKELIGESQYNQLFGPGGQLEGYSVSSFSLNGIEVNEEALKPIARDISDGKKSLLETIIVDE